MNLNLEQMTISDLTNIKDMLEKDFDDFWNYNILSEELASPYSYYIVAKKDEEIVRFCRF